MKLDCKISLAKDGQKQNKYNFTDRCVIQNIFNIVLYKNYKT